MHESESWLKPVVGNINAMQPLHYCLVWMDERHYQLVAPSDISDEELNEYNRAE